VELSLTLGQACIPLEKHNTVELCPPALSGGSPGVVLAYFVLISETTTPVPSLPLFDLCCLCRLAVYQFG